MAWTVLWNPVHLTPGPLVTSLMFIYPVCDNTAFLLTGCMVKGSYHPSPVC